MLIDFENYFRNSEGENVHLNYQTQPSASISETVSYKSQDFYQNTDDYNNSQEYTAFSQNFKNYNSTSPEKNVFSDIYISQQPMHQNFLNHQQYSPLKRLRNNSKISNVNTINLKDLTNTSNSQGTCFQPI